MRLPALAQRLRLWWHERGTRRKMDRVFSRRADPFDYERLPYERARFAAMEKALRPCGSILEVGCAEGAFTERLARLAPRVSALDISAVALGRARRRPGCASVRFVESDLRRWSPTHGERFGAIVIGDVLYYLDKPLVQEEFRETIRRVASWLEPGGLLLLAHAFAGALERPSRESFRRRFEEEGLRLVSERVIGEGEAEGKVCCLLSVLQRVMAPS